MLLSDLIASTLEGWATALAVAATLIWAKEWRGE